jgi:hypothetical protein
LLISSPDAISLVTKSVRRFSPPTAGIAPTGADMKLTAILVGLSSVAALRISPAATSRRAVLGGLAAAMAPLAAFAADSDVLERARSDSLTYERAIERAKAGELVKPATLKKATCYDISKLIMIDEQAIIFEKGKLAGLGNAPGSEKDEILKTVEKTEKKISEQLKMLKAMKDERKAQGLPCI